MYIVRNSKFPWTYRKIYNVQILKEQFYNKVISFKLIGLTVLEIQLFMIFFSCWKIEEIRWREQILIFFIGSKKILLLQLN